LEYEINVWSKLGLEVVQPFLSILMFRN